MANSTDMDNSDLIADLKRTRKALRRFNPRGSEGRRILLTGGLGHMGSRVMETYLEALPAAEFYVADFPRNGAEDRWADQSRVTFLPVDFLVTGSVPSLLDRLTGCGGLTDAICIHGGIGREDWELPREDHHLQDEELCRLNFESVYELIRRLLDREFLHGTREDPATATVVGSISRFAQWYPPGLDHWAYSDAKNDLYYAIVYLASQVGDNSLVRFNIVSPGTIRDTCSAQVRNPNSPWFPEGFPLGAMADGYDVGDAMLALTEMCRKSTGIEIRVDGGQYLAPSPYRYDGTEMPKLEEVEKGREVVERIEEKLAGR
jgi:NAD(P)-dependent dehydrogenase (short-subunit alcohol dehydrogenase family)